MLTHIQSCRVCGNDTFQPVVDLGYQHFQGCFKKDGHAAPPARKTPNRLVRCDTEHNDGCGLVQTAHSIDTDLLYLNYWYQSGISDTMKKHLRDITIEARSMIPATSGITKVLDIASNDNTLLRCYEGDRFTRIGIDPSDIAAKQTDKDIHVINDTFPSAQLDEMWNVSNTASIITSIACFYDVDDPVKFAMNVGKHLKKDGIWIFEVAYLKSMIDNLSYDSIVNEHVIHYHLYPILRLLDMAGLKLVRARKTGTNGGSVMCYVTHQGCSHYDNKEWRAEITDLKVDEFNASLDTNDIYDDFANRIDQHTSQLKDLIKDINLRGKTIHVYGSSTKLNTLLECCGLTGSDIPYAAERSEEKFGAETMSGIKIISEEESRAMKPDYYLVGPYHFKKEILEREAEAIYQGMKFIFPLPILETLPNL